MADKAPNVIREDTPEFRAEVLAQLQADAEAQRDFAMNLVDLIVASDLPVEPVSWLWKNWLAKGKLHILAGAPGTGKTTIACHFAACISAGLPFPSGEMPIPGTVVIWSGEDDPADTLVPRLMAAGADLSRIQFIGNVPDHDGRRPFDPARDVDFLAKRLAYVDDLAMIIIDPIVMAIVGDSHKNAEVRRGLDPLVRLAAGRGAALLGISHFSKGTQGRDPLERVTGSLGFGAVARIVHGTARLDPGNGETPSLIFARLKSNLGPDGDGFHYKIEEVATGAEQVVSATRIAWGEYVSGSPRNLLQTSDETDGPVNDAVEFLRDLLSSGPMHSLEVFREASRAGYSKDQMHRAKSRASAVTRRSGFDGNWMWQLTRSDDSQVGEPRDEPSEPRGENSTPSSLGSIPRPLPSDRF